MDNSGTAGVSRNGFYNAPDTAIVPATAPRHKHGTLERGDVKRGTLECGDLKGEDLSDVSDGPGEGLHDTKLR